MRWIAAAVVCLVCAGSARADDWDAVRDPFDPALIGRYEAILAKDPHDDFALRHLVELYKRYRTVGKLEAEYRAKLDAGEDWATLVVIARLPRPSRSESVALWKRAVAAKPDDALGWLAVGDATVDAPSARDAYRHAASLVTAPRQKRAALTKLIGAARSAGDADGVDGAYVELIALAPKDGMLWLDRGNAQLAAKRAQPALDSFTAAEPLLATDPERQLTAITNQALALEQLGRTDDAIARYERALDKMPRGYFLGRELVLRIVDVERKLGQLGDAIARLEKRWPERGRGYFEWATLGDLYGEGHDDERALAAYKRAVAIAPTEVTTQRRLIALLDKLRPDDALAQHEAAARLAPGDADLQIALAKRYHDAQPAKAIATLETLAKRMAANVNVRNSIATLYDQWNELGRAIREYEAIAAIEPDDPDHAIVLGEAYWRAAELAKALEAWKRLDKIGTPVALFREGETLALHEVWDDATVAYGKALALDGTNVDAWYGRARAYDGLRRYTEAADDARRAVALTAQATQVEGLRNRQMLVRVLRHGGASLDASVAKWRFAFDRGEIAAGYMLVAHHARNGSGGADDVLDKLYRLVPTDDSLGLALARSLTRRRDFTGARHVLEGIAQRTPKRADEMAELIAQVDRDREHAERDVRLEEEGRSSQGEPDLVGRDHRFGVRLALGSDVRGASGEVLGLGMYRTYRLANGASFVGRFDWTKRDDPMGEVDAFEVGGSVALRLVDARKFELAVAAGPRFELRYGYDGPRNRGGIAGDLALELLPRALPATLGLRFAQSLTDPDRRSALVVELGFEIR